MEVYKPIWEALVHINEATFFLHLTRVDKLQRSKTR